jgi:hypothetical protein
MMGRFVYRGMVFGCIAAIAAGCSSGPQVRSDYDRSADFGQYRTYGFVTNPDTDTREFKSMATQMLEAAASREMEARGYQRANEPDLVINFQGKLEEKTDIVSTPAPYYGPSWGYGGWYGAPYGGYGFGGGTDVSTRRYNYGTVIVDVVDRRKRQVVWQGGVEGEVSKKALENREQSINHVIAELFQQYPFVAGQSAPVVTTDKKK